MDRRAAKAWAGRVSARRIYLDHAATTPCRPEVVAAMAPLFADGGYNPSSQHAEGRRAREALDSARARVARLLRAKPREIVFTSGGSESDALAILGVARARRGDGRHAVTAATEHHAVLHAFDALRDDGWSVTVLPVDGEGRVSPRDFAAALRPQTVLASIMLANNEIGTLAPVAELATIARARGVVFHTDAVQAPGCVPLDAQEVGADLISLSAHKFYGPKGVGLLYVRDGTPLAPLVVGGGQEAGFRGGTENVAGIVGLAAGLELAVAETPHAANRMGSLRAAFEAAVVAAIPDAVVYGAGAERLPNISCVGFAGVDADALLARLDLDGIAVSRGSACASGSAEPSHVIAALGRGTDGPRGVIRFSLGRQTTAGEVEGVMAVLPLLVVETREYPAFVGTS
jgi:cysteine desulfurase